jgi:hypothetical protein
MSLLLKITPITEERDDCQYCSHDEFVGFKHEEVELSTLIKELSPNQLMNLGLMRITAEKDKKPDELAVMTLKKWGWVHAETIKDRAERKQMEEEFYLLEGLNQGLSYSYGNLYKLDLDNVSPNIISKLGHQAKIVQVVNPKTVLKESDYKKLETEKKRRQEAAKKASEAKKVVAEKKRLAKIEKAKKILAEAGETQGKDSK